MIIISKKFLKIMISLITQYYFQIYLNPNKMHCQTKHLKTLNLLYLIQ